MAASPLDKLALQTRSAANMPQPSKPKKESAPEDPYLELKSNIHRRLIEEIDLNQLSEKNGPGLREQIKDAINHLLMEENTLLTMKGHNLNQPALPFTSAGRLNIIA